MGVQRQSFEVPEQDCSTMARPNRAEDDDARRRGGGCARRGGQGPDPSAAGPLLRRHRGLADGQGTDGGNRLGVGR